MEELKFPKYNLQIKNIEYKKASKLNNCTKFIIDVHIYDKTGNLLKRLDNVFVEETRLRIKSQQPRVVKIKTMKKIEASVSKVQYQEEVF